jgi:hypothetical protein
VPEAKTNLERMLVEIPLVRDQAERLRVVALDERDEQQAGSTAGTWMAASSAPAWARMAMRTPISRTTGTRVR